jgi:hypothetical protein
VGAVKGGRSPAQRILYGEPRSKLCLWNGAFPRFGRLLRLFIVRRSKSRTGSAAQRERAKGVSPSSVVGQGRRSRAAVASLPESRPTPSSLNHLFSAKTRRLGFRPPNGSISPFSPAQRSRRKRLFLPRRRLSMRQRTTGEAKPLTVWPSVRLFEQPVVLGARPSSTAFKNRDCHHQPPQVAPDLNLRFH